MAKRSAEENGKADAMKNSISTTLARNHFSNFEHRAVDVSADGSMLCTGAPGSI